ncbi:MAG: hypothetical protein JWM44_985 [Bacilli bacterium]|nr:hypothetical protein [Bacilli bacterium]
MVDLTIIRGVILMNDISPNFKGPNAIDSAIIKDILRFEATPKAIIRFAELQNRMSDDEYWLVLSTLWVSYSGWSDLNLWRKLFRSGRPKRSSSLMKPSELTVFERLPDKFIVFRAHRPFETDWISYTLDIDIAKRFAKERNTEVTAYTICKKHCIALFLRRDELEVIMLDPKKVINGHAAIAL